MGKRATFLCFFFFNRGIQLINVTRMVELENHNLAIVIEIISLAKK